MLTLSPGVAGGAAVYSIAKKLLMDPLPIRAEEEIVDFAMEGSWSEAEFLFMRPEIQGFESLALFRRMDVPMQPDDGPARLITGAAGTAELFQVLGVGTALGTVFRAGDDGASAEPVVVLSHSLWRELGGDPAVVGSRIELAGVHHTVAGVMPRWFPDPTVRIWLANRLDADDYSGNWGIVGRLRQGLSPEALAGELDRFMTVMHQRFNYPDGQWDGMCPTA